MNNSYQAQILSKIQDISIPTEIDTFLTNLVNTEKNIFDVTPDSTSFFYDAFSPQIKRHELNSTSFDEKQINLIAQCIKWSKDHWIQSTEDEKVQKSILIYSIFDYFRFSEDILDWTSINQQYVKKVVTILSKIHTSIHIPDHAPYHEKKAYEEFQQSIENKNFGKILQFLRSMGNSSPMSIFLRSTVKIAFKISLDNFANFLSKSSQTPSLVKEILNVLDTEPTLIFFADQYDEREPFPLIIFFDTYIRNEERSRDQKNTLDSERETDKLVLIFEKIMRRLEQPEPLCFFTKNLNLSWNSYYHLILGQYIASHIEYITEYSKIIDFDAPPANGTAFWKSFIKKLESEMPLKKLSSLIDQNYFLYVDSKNTLRVNQLNGYINFIYNAIHIHCDSFEKYDKELSTIVINIQNLINGWNHSKLTSQFHKLFLSITANAACLNYTFTNDSSEVLTFLSDNRLKQTFGDDIDLLKQCLIEPSQISEFPVTNNDGKTVKIRFHQTEEKNIG